MAVQMGMVMVNLRAQHRVHHWGHKFELRYTPMVEV